MSIYIIRAKSKVIPIPGSKSPFKTIYKVQDREIEIGYKWKNVDEWINSYIFIKKEKMYLSCFCRDIGQAEFFTKEGNPIPAEWVEQYIDEPKHRYGAAFELETIKVLGMKR